MSEILLKAGAFLFLILLGYLLKQAGVFRKEDFSLISRIVFRLTLPAAIITNFSSITIDASLLFMAVLGLSANVLMVATGFLMNLRNSKSQQAFEMINLSGYNIGCFAMPFVQSFLGPVGFAATGFFDAGNAVMCTGGTYTAASMAAGKERHPSLSTCLKSLFSSVPFDTYIVMTVLALLQISLPKGVLILAQTAGNANPFLALLGIGIAFELHLDRQTLKEIGKILILRYGIAIAAAFACFLLLPLELELRQTLAILVLAPVSSLAPVFTQEIGEDTGLSGAVNSISILISTALMTAAMILVL